MPIIDVLLVITLATLAVLWLRRGIQTPQQQIESAYTRQQLEEAFYRLLKEENSCISLIQLAAASRIDVQQARQYLEQQVKMLGAVPEVDADGDTFYRFPKLHRRSASDKLA
ncbi:MAG: hypothetical protein KME06_10510 [Kastovskya adunca ATA6-11-RM4]|jgi:hypothetical protein|nr:hypothetical protein [Kastovskya adunca ATA6-11-RM4]